MRSPSRRRRVTRALTTTAAAATLLLSTVGAAHAAVVTTHDPLGNLDKVVLTSWGTVQARGWAWDPDTTASVQVVMSVDSATKTATANGRRTDVQRVYLAAGSNRGFIVDMPATPGTHRVCITARNVGAGANRTFPCQTVVVPGTPPVGFLDAVQPQENAVHVAGWAVDPDTAGSPVDVQVQVDGALATTTSASLSRPDVQAAHPAYGSQTGFAVTVPAAPGSHQVCLTAVGGSGEPNTSLGCATVEVLVPAPKGQLTSAADSLQGGVRVTGTASSWDGSRAVPVRLSVDGEVTTVQPSASAPFAFSASITAAPGSHQVCATAVDSTRSTDLGCRTVTVVNHDVIGGLDAVTGQIQAVTVTGWAADRDTTDPLTVVVSVDGATHTFSTGMARSDVSATFADLPGNTGYKATLEVVPGKHSVCVSAENVGAGQDKAFGCAPVDVAAAVTTPGPSTTGVRPGTLLTVYNGDLKVTTAGTVIENLDIRGYLRIDADDVTVRNVIVRGRPGLTTSTGLITNTGGHPGLTVTDSELYPSEASPWINGFIGSNASLTRVNIHGVIDQVHVTGSNVVVDSSWLHDNLHYAVDPNQGGTPSHDDNVQVQAGNNIVVRNSVLSGSHSAAAMITQDSGKVTGFVFTGNTADNGSCTVNIAEKTYGAVAATITNNAFGNGQAINHCAVIAKTTTQAVSTIAGNTFIDGTAWKVNRG